jgi:exosome complex RNA-binding protein Rrp4
MTGVDELKTLAADRDLVTSEIHETNDFYGHAHLLKAYTGLSLDPPLKVAIEHGIRLHDTVWDLDVKTPLPVFLCASERTAREYERLTQGRKKAFPIGPLISYIPPQPAPSPAEKTLLAFPAHSTHHINTVFDVEDFITRINSIRPDFDRVLICMYWRDVLRDAHRPFTERGFECVTAGHIYDVQFLSRLANILSRASMVYTNTSGTHVFYAVALNKPVWIDSAPIDYRGESSTGWEVLRQLADWAQHPNHLKTLELFSEPRDHITPQQREFAAEIIGLDHTRSPEELREILEFAEKMYGRQQLETKLRKLFTPRHLYQSLRYRAGRLAQRIKPQPDR